MGFYPSTLTRLKCASEHKLTCTESHKESRACTHYPPSSRGDQNHWASFILRSSTHRCTQDEEDCSSVRFETASHLRLSALFDRLTSKPLNRVAVTSLLQLLDGHAVMWECEPEEHNPEIVCASKTKASLRLKQQTSSFSLVSV